ncbi:hypothetical protein F751_6207 [Auxenochlorella protothecoides]|uniref:Uncharacterized protein n=1 Tax=Auxenochlorella protothecoides TaxID=3075 RepID=A0A087SK02_AUXPR|nr:hypothetical protein F751_6207 [Auxenochlorella protothecoides]KFM26056.1 hypothetical protein F751_6207 [Auxenochlorella protothecoides]
MKGCRLQSRRSGEDEGSGRAWRRSPVPGIPRRPRWRGRGRRRRPPAPAR